MIRLASFLDHEGGWARTARCFAQSLSRHETTELIDWQNLPAKGLKAWVARSRWRLSRDSAGISLGAIERIHTLGTKYRIAFHNPESSRVPIPHLARLFQADMVWSMSQWGRDLLESHGMPASKIRVVPSGVDPMVFAPPRSSPPTDVFRFLCVGKWEERKNTVGLVHAFATEFHPSEPVELVMHCGATFPRKVDFRQEISKTLASAGRVDARVVSSEPVSLSCLVHLMGSCHAFVLPTRGEAWGLPILEAMACGLPCIVTDSSGLREYANPDNCYLIRVAEMRPVHDPEFYDPGYDWGSWAQPDDAHLRHLMRFLYEHPDDARRKGQRARQDVERLWSWDSAAQVAIAHIRELRS